MRKRIYNTIKAGDSDNDLDSTFNLAGKDAEYKQFGFGKWYGKSIATVAVNRYTNIAVIAWQDGYFARSNKVVEHEINEFINR
jgi:hypothetical protein